MKHYIKKYQDPSDSLNKTFKTKEELDEEFFKSKPLSMDEIRTKINSMVSNISYDEDPIKYMDNLDNAAETGKIEEQKSWLHNWYQKRLPVINKQHLGSYVLSGLQTLYNTPTYLQKQGIKPSNSYILGTYFSNINKWLAPEYLLQNKNARDSHINIYNLKLRESTPIHEFTHATQYGGSSKINPDFYNNYKSNSGEDYFNEPYEQHSKIMELRYLNNLDPTKTNYTIKDLEQIDREGILQELRKGGMSDEDIVNALNTWAYNHTKNNVKYVKQGSKLNYSNLF